MQTFFDGVAKQLKNNREQEFMLPTPPESNNNQIFFILFIYFIRCTVDDRVTRVAWLNRSTILYAGNDKWSIDDRVVILTNTKTQYSIKIHNVDIYDEGPYTCSVQTDNHPKTSRVHLIVQGKTGCMFAVEMNMRRLRDLQIIVQG